MPFKCQRDSYLKQYSTVVLSCSSSKLKLCDTELDGYDVYLKDTILFPEGGGQPYDLGTISDVPVLHVRRVGDKACHFTKKSFDDGTDVEVRVDWERRFDHMQQHSGQHLITAVLDARYDYNTTSWNLGSAISFIELNTSCVTSEQLNEAEDEINDKITRRTPVRVDEYHDVTALQDAEIRTRGLPDDHSGPVRIVTIEGVESNMCCGTHVSNLGHLQVVKLLYTEKAKKGKTNLYFVVGRRVRNYLGSCIERERNLMTVLKSNPESHFQLVDKLQKNLKSVQKNCLSLMRDMAALEGYKFSQQNPRPNLMMLHRSDADPEFMMRLVNSVSDDKVTFFLSVGNEKGDGAILLTGPNQIASDLGSKICELVGGKGFTKNGIFQAKVLNLAKRKDVEKIIKDYIKVDS